jgi:DMSO/TMAO reductase YedYZ molybdopterin-dependent catalytic subunit
MRQPGADALEFRADGEGAAIQGPDPGGDAHAAGDQSEGPFPRRADPGAAETAGQLISDDDLRPRLPPGQYLQASLPVLHYGPVPACNQQTWDLRVYGATRSGRAQRGSWSEFRALSTREIVADVPGVSKFTVLGITWSGIAAAELLRVVPASPAATHMMVWADFGYGANLPIEVLSAPDTLLATGRDGKELSPEQGYPVRLIVPSRYGWKNVKWVRAIEYMIGDRRGFWEERGYHNNADPWREQRYSYQELPGEGPEI